MEWNEISLKKTKIDPFVMSIMDKALPKIADQDIKGAILEISNAYYEKKGIKVLNSAYTKYLENKFENLIRIIPAKNYFEIILTLSDIVLVSDNYFNKNIVPDDSNLNKNKAVNSVADTSSISHDINPVIVDHELIKNDLKQINSFSLNINCVSFTPFGGFVILYGKNKIAYKSLPKSASDAIDDAISKNCKIKYIAFTATGGFVILHGKNGVISSSIPAPALETLKELNNKEKTINFISFTPDGGYVIVYDDYGCVSKSMPNGLNEVLSEANSNELKIKSISFEEDGGYVVIYGRNGWKAEQISKLTSDRLHELNNNSMKIDFVSFIPGGGHVIVNNGNGYSYNDSK